MKFAIVVVLLALALGIECHVLGYTSSSHSSPLTYTAHGPFVNGGVVNAYSAGGIVPYTATAYSAGPVVSPLSYASPYAAAPLAYAAAPLPYAAASLPYAAAPLPYAAAALPYSAAALPYSAAALPYAAAPVVAAAAEGSYVAQTRGSVHVAPLPGHVNSAASVNLEPAPGTL